MEYMESKMQQRYEAYEDHIESLEPFINDLLAICKKHNISNSDLKTVNELFEKGYMPPLEVSKEINGR